MIEIKNLCVSFDEKEILKNISVNFMKNKITAIIGQSGSGKTTLLNTISLINEDYAGEIFFESQNIKTIKKEILRKNIGMLLQNATPFPMSILQNLTYAPIYHGVKDKDVLNDLVVKLLKECSLYNEVKDKLDKSALTLSGGQKQRLCLARTLSVNPKVLLLDEPCSSLDINNTKIIENTLLSLSKNHTTIIITHNLSQAKRIADKIVFMQDGKIIEQGDKDELFTNPKSKDLKKYLEDI